jgi:hypothetical protein
MVTFELTLGGQHYGEIILTLPVGGLHVKHAVTLLWEALTNPLL